MTLESALEPLVPSIVRTGDETMRALATSGLAHRYARQWPDAAEYRAAGLAAGRDERLKTILARTDGKSPIVSSVAFASAIHAMLLPAGLIASALLELIALGEPLTVESVLTLAQRNATSMRRIADGEPIEVLTVIGLTGFNLPAGGSIQTKAGILRSADSFWQEWLKRDKNLPTTILLARVQLVCHVNFPDRSTPPAKVEAAAYNALEIMQRPVTNMRLAVVLGADETQPPVRPTVTMQTVVMPWHGLMSTLAPPFSQHGIYRRDPLTEAELGAVRRWAAGVADCPDLDRINVAITRILSAATERVSVADSLIDAVIGWENLFGTSVETNFRAAAALTMLLEPDYIRREARLRELSSLYGQRSRLVHGEETDMVKVATQAIAAVGVAKEALRRIIGEEQWLLTLDNSTRRANALLLGDPRLRSSQSPGVHLTGPNPPSEDPGPSR